MNIFSLIRSENDAFFTNDIVVVPGYSFNQYETLKRIHLYLNNKYEDGTSYLGRDKLFFDVVTPPCEVAAKMLNVDTKNIKLWPDNPRNYFATFLLEKELKQWLKRTEFGEILNTIAKDLPRYGSVVLEKTPDGAEVVDLRKLILDPGVECIKDSRFVTTVHYMTPTQLRNTSWIKSAVESAIEKFGNPQQLQAWEDQSFTNTTKVSGPYIKVYKRYGEVPEYMIKGGKSEKMVPALFIVAGADYMAKNAEGKPVTEVGEILYKSAWEKEWPFQDFHYYQIPGRWLGVGVVEKLFDVQVRFNELKNQKRVSMELSTMHLFQTPDKQIIRNVLTDLDNGDLIISPNGITPIVNEERNLPAFESEEASYKLQADRLSFAYEAVRGESMPASTPATNAVMASNSATSVFAFKREDVTIAYQEFFNEMVLPQLLKDLTPEHIMRFVGSAQELEKMDQAATEIYINDFIKQRLLEMKPVGPADIEMARLYADRELKKLGETRYVKIKNAFYKDVNFEFDFIIGNEQADPATIIQNTQSVLMAIAQNPPMLQDPRIKMLFYKYAEKLGVSPAEIELADQQATSAPQLNPAMIQGVPENMQPIPRTNVPQPMPNRVMMTQ